MDPTYYIKRNKKMIKNYSDVFEERAIPKDDGVKEAQMKKRHRDKV